MMQDGREVSCKAHNLKIGGANPPPAPIFLQRYTFVTLILVILLSHREIAMTYVYSER